MAQNVIRMNMRMDRPDGHVQTINNQFGAHVISRRPAQRPLGMLVPDRAQVNIALTAGHP